MISMGTNDVAPKRTGYYPWWLDNLADDATGEGAAMQGILQRPASSFPGHTSRAPRGCRY
jgi:hypothetical protein